MTSIIHYRKCWLCLKFVTKHKSISFLFFEILTDLLFNIVSRANIHQRLLIAHAFYRNCKPLKDFSFYVSKKSWDANTIIPRNDTNTFSKIIVLYKTNFIFVSKNKKKGPFFFEIVLFPDGFLRLIGKLKINTSSKTILKIYHLQHESWLQLYLVCKA